MHEDLHVTAVEDSSRRATLSQDDARFLGSLFDHGKPKYLKGADLRRARRLIDFGMTEQGRLGERYYGLTAKGHAFVKQVRS